MCRRRPARRRSELLAASQLAHLTQVPFENLHVFHRRGVRTDTDWSYPKIVEQRRGGWCFELNGCFGALLRAVGFTVDYISCQVWSESASGARRSITSGWWCTSTISDGSSMSASATTASCRPAAARRRAPGDASPGPHRDRRRFVHLDRADARRGLARRSCAAGCNRANSPTSPLAANTSLLRPISVGRRSRSRRRALDDAGSRITLRRDLLRIRAGNGPFVETPGRGVRVERSAGRALRRSPTRRTR